MSLPGRNTNRGAASNSDLPDKAVREHVAHICQTKGFLKSERLKRFLSYTVERLLANDTDTLKEYAIALEVFDRSAAYNPKIDAVVRVEAPAAFTAGAILRNRRPARTDPHSFSERLLYSGSDSFEAGARQCRVAERWPGKHARALVAGRRLFSRCGDHNLRCTCGSAADGTAIRIPGMPGCWARTSCLRAWKTEETHAGGHAIRALEINKEEPHTPESEVMSPPVTGGDVEGDLRAGVLWKCRTVERSEGLPKLRRTRDISASALQNQRCPDGLHL